MKRTCPESRTAAVAIWLLHGRRDPVLHAGMEAQNSFDYWDYFIAETERANAPLYTQIVRGIAGDSALRELAARVKTGQPPANILLASVHYLLLRGAQHPLRRFYPNLN